MIKVLPLFYHPYIIQLLLAIVKVICLLIAIAYYTIAERKIMAAIQRRRGPNVVGFWGLLQPLADGLKLIAKEMVVPSHANSRIFVFAPMLILTLSLLSWTIVPFGCFDYSEYFSSHSAANFLIDGPKRSENDPISFAFIALSVAWGVLLHLIWVPPTHVEEVRLVKKVCPTCETDQSTYETVYHPYRRDDEVSADNEEITPKESSLFDGDSDVFSSLRDYNPIVELNDIANTHYGLLIILAISSLTVYGLIIAGWSSNSKYAFLGALRSAAQMISYEVAISLIILPIVLMSGSLNLVEIVMAQSITVWFIIPLFPISIIFFISMIAETNRTPFDLPEAEAELVAGYNVEYSSIIFAMFFLAEYGNMILMSTLNAILFLGGWTTPFAVMLPSATVLALKALIFCFLLVLVRATFPRYRYDQLMDIGWKIFLPVTTGFLLLVVGILLCTDALPVIEELTNFSIFDSSWIEKLPIPARIKYFNYDYSY